MSKQQYTSADTSINSVKLPAIYGKLAARDILRGVSVIDYGCGKYTAHLRTFACEHGAHTWQGYDKYNQDKDTNRNALNGLYDVAIVSNVLNVVKEDDIVREIVAHALDLAETVYITVYSGDKSGVGKPTQNGKSWQRNVGLEWYVDFLSTDDRNHVEKVAGMIKVSRI